jgi:flagellin
MDALSLNGSVLNQQARTQSSLQTDVQRLSSGLRINSAADDPSGLAISQTLATQVAGLDEGAQSIQTASNALTVADGAMQTITDLLQRMRTLIVEARSGLMSSTDQADIQTELNQLTAEVNRVAQNTTFNGRSLLDGSASSQIVTPIPSYVLAQNDALTNGGTLIDTTVNPPNIVAGSPQLVQTVTVESYDPTTGTLDVHVDIGSQNPNFGPDQTADVTVAVGTNYPVGAPPPTPGNPDWIQLSNNSTGTQVLSFDIGTLTAADVGKTATLVTLDPQFKASGSALQVNTGSSEGSTVSVDIPAMNATNLGVNDLVLGTDLINEGAEYRVDYALNMIGNVRANVGAQTVALQESATNANTAAVNTQASESAIADLNVAAQVTSFTKDQILAQFQMKMLAENDTMAQSVVMLVSSSLA